MAKYPSPITQENFPLAWKLIARKRRWSIKKELIRRITVSVAQLLYFFIFLILALGVFYEMCGPLVRRYMDQFPEVNLWWTQISTPVLADATTEAMRILRCAGALYLIPFCAAVPMAILIALLYHPRTPKQTGDPAQDAWQLRGLAKHAQIYAQRKENDTAKICSFFMGMIMVLFVLGMMLFAYRDPSLRGEVVAQAHLANLRCFGYGLAMFLLYRIINLPLKFLLKLLHFCHVPASLVTDTEQYYAQFNTQEKTEVDA